MTIKAENVSFSYPPNIPALRGISLEIANGEFVALMGENGAGKTTLIKHFNGLLKPSSGRVLIDGVETTRRSVAELSREVGIVFQNPNHQLFCDDVESEISFALKNFGFDPPTIKRRVDWVLELLGIEKHRHTSPILLSEGEKKRVALACVLAWDPKCLVVDEPTLGQDYSHKKRLLELLKTLNRDGRTVIIVTHDVEFAVRCQCRVCLMTAGRLIADGAADEILTDAALVKKAALLLPQVTEVFQSLIDLGFPPNIVGIQEARDFITRKILESHRG
ncbi:MAG: ABC transporter ATP-binding protein [Candidatus Bathyarchaeia archaeon]